MRHLLLPLALLFTFQLSASGQGLHTPNGFAASARYTQTGKVPMAGYGLDLGFVTKGRFELGFGVNLNTVEGDDVSMLDLTPRIAIYALRATDSLPVTLSLSGGYSFTSYQGDFVDAIEEAGGELSGSGLFGGVNATLHARLSNKVSFLPTFGLRLQSLTSKFSGFGESNEETDSFKVITLATPVAINLGSRALEVGPVGDLWIAEGGTEFSFGFRAGIAFGR